MKLWLNHILACPDDKIFPFALRIYKWELEEENFTRLLSGYQKKLLMNYKNPEDKSKIHILNAAKFQDDVKSILQENIKITVNKNLQNIISISYEKGKILIRDWNKVNPESIEKYLTYYREFLDEFELITDDSDNKTAIIIQNIVKTTIKDKVNRFCEENDFKNFNEIEDKVADESIYSFIRTMEPIFQDLLLLNYYLFFMEIDEGILICPKCSRWFPIIETIPRILPKSMDRTDLDKDFKSKWKGKFPANVV
jgi:uncharacterized protein YbaR (Trm112 family)